MRSPRTDATGPRSNTCRTRPIWLHRYDPTRLVGVDIWGDHPPTGTPGPIYNDIDAIAETDYSGWYDSPETPPPSSQR